MIKGRVELERDDVLDALNSQPGSHFKHAVGFGVCITALIVVMRSTPSGASPPWLVVALLCAAPLLSVFSKRVIATRMYNQLPSAKKRMEISVSKEGLTIESASGKTNLPWAEVQSTREGARSFLIYSSARNFLIFPKRAFKGPELLRVKLLFAQHSPPVKLYRFLQPQYLMWALLAVIVVVLFGAVR